MKLNCEFCGKEFNKKPLRIKRDKHHYCCKDCADKAKGSLEVECVHCGKRMKRGKKLVEKAQRHFCSRGCMSAYTMAKNLVNCSCCGRSIIRVDAERKGNTTGLYFCNMKCKSQYYKHLNTVECEICGKSFYKSGAERHRYPRHCCSIECRSLLNNKKMKLECKNCGKQIYRPPSIVANKQNIFCSKKCHDEFQDMKQEVKCDKCGDMFKKGQCFLDRTKHNFCCTDCASKYWFENSFVETEFENLVKTLGVQYERNTRKVVHPLELDFYFPDIKFAVEINGSVHYEPMYGMGHLAIVKERDKRKREKCKQLGIQLRTIKVGNCKRETYMPRYKRVIWEIKKLR